MEPIRVYAEKGKKAILCCPFCNRFKQEAADQFLGEQKVRDILCSCGKIYQVEIEFRKLHRKKTLLNGTCTNTSSSGTFDKILVTNLSLGGCGFELISTRKLREGDRIRITFPLDNAASTMIKENAIVTSVRDRYVGCKFEESNSASRADIRSYLQNSSAGRS